MIPNLRGLLVIAGFLPLLGLPAQTTDTPWAAYYGCWTPVENAALGSPPITCIVPATENAVRVVTARAGQTLRDVTLIADGTQIAVEDERCSGWESASFSDDGARLYLRGETRCGTTPVVRTSGLYAILPNGDWLEIAGARTGDGEQLRVERSRIVPWFDLPPELVEDLEPLMRSAGAARLAAGRMLRVEDVIEVSGRVDPSVAEVWIAEVSFDMREDAFRVGTRDLRTLAAAQVPTRVIDMLVAVANPGHFAVAVSQQGAASIPLVPANVAGGSAFDGSAYTRMMHCSPMGFGFPMSPFGFNGLMGFPLNFYGGGLFDCFGGSPLAFDSRYGLFGWSRAGMYPGFFPGWGGFPITVTVGRGGPAPSGGRVIRGRGYSEGPGTAATGGTASAQPRNASVRSSQSRPRANAAPASTRTSSRPSTPSRSSPGSSSGASSGSSSSSSSGASSGSSGRTAKPRNP
jgi:hypothetical protein